MCRFVGMTTQEALNELKSQNKPYAGIMSQPYFCNTVQRIEKGLSKATTVEKFLAKFGYEPVKNEAQWKRK